MSTRTVLILVGCVLGAPLLDAKVEAAAPGVYLEPDAFIASQFAAPPAAQVLWLDEPLRNELTQVLGHEPRALRYRYWADGMRSAWILDEIGKDKPITLGIVVANGSIETLQVLIFRESRGWEIRHAFFTDQFKNARLDSNRRLSPAIDGITGATLSVRAANRVAAAALVLDARLHADAPTGQM